MSEPAGSAEWDARSFCYSLDEERYEGVYATREEAHAVGLDEADSNADADGQEHVVWTGRITNFAPRMNGHSAIDLVCEQAYDTAEELAAGWLEKVPDALADELTRDLSAAFSAWMHRHGLTPRFWAVDDIVEHHAARAPSSGDTPT